MHELALADAVITAALQAAAADGMVSIRKLTVRIGEMQRIEPETFEFALRQVLPTTDARLRDARLVIEREPARLICRRCSRAFSLAQAAGPLASDAAEAIHFVPELAHAFLTCPDCGSSDFEVVEGRGVSIASIEGD